jgi:hypothetical protein
MARARPPSPGGGSPGSGGGSSSVLRFMNRGVTVLRGVAADAYGDESDVGTPYLTGVPASIAETSQTAFDAATQRLSVIRAVKCIMPGWADVRETDTLVDEFTGWAYMIEDLQQEPGLGYYPPRTILTLRLRSGVAVAGDT